MYEQKNGTHLHAHHEGDGVMIHRVPGVSARDVVALRVRVDGRSFGVEHAEALLHLGR